MLLAPVDDVGKPPEAPLVPVDAGLLLEQGVGVEDDAHVVVERGEVGVDQALGVPLLHGLQVLAEAVLQGDAHHGVAVHLHIVFGHHRAHAPGQGHRRAAVGLQHEGVLNAGLLRGHQDVVPLLHGGGLLQAQVLQQVLAVGHALVGALGFSGVVLADDALDHQHLAGVGGGLPAALLVGLQISHVVGHVLADEGGRCC